MHVTRRAFGRLVATVLAVFGAKASSPIPSAVSPIPIPPTASAFDQMTCPTCGNTAHYVCSNLYCSCRNLPIGHLSLLWTAEGEGLRCPYCDFTAHIDFWFERDLNWLNRSERTRL